MQKYIFFYEIWVLVFMSDITLSHASIFSFPLSFIHILYFLSTNTFFHLFVFSRKTEKKQFSS